MDYSDFSSTQPTPPSLQEGITYKVVRKQWPARTMFHWKNCLRRQEILEHESLQSVLQDEKKEIWDLDYMSTSDEEDNDSEGDD